MENTKTRVPFRGTQEQANELTQLMELYAGDPSALMPIMQGAQGIYGYLPIEVQTMIAAHLEIPIEEVYSTATFYSQFALNPKGKHQISVCLGTACYVKGSGLVLDELVSKLGIASGETTEDGLFTLEACRCIGACGLAPVMTIGEDVYARISTDDIDGILDNYRK